MPKLHTKIEQNRGSQEGQENENEAEKESKVQIE
jgi:hypothetical protein